MDVSWVHLCMNLVHYECELGHLSINLQHYGCEFVHLALLGRIGSKSIVFVVFGRDCGSILLRFPERGAWFAV